MTPLAERRRPKQLNEYIGQEHLTGKEGVLLKAIQLNNIPSMILWGPPGVGKTTLAQLIAAETKRPFYALSAIHSGVKDVRDTIESAKKNRFFEEVTPLLFIDEIHRFSKSQQDSLLGAVEKGIVVLIGATTENPSFEVIPALLSRCQVYVLKALEKEHLIQMATDALLLDEYYKHKKIVIKEYEALLIYSGGDGRKLLNIIELVANLYEAGKTLEITNELVEKTLQQNIAIYDKNGEMHYDTISAFIKSIRGSDPNAALYWLARMLNGGEDIEFISRRLIILASEDIGLANPNALLMATTCQQAIKQIGMPEARIILSQTVVYLATSPKSNSTYMAIEKAMELASQTSHYPIPLPLRNAPTKLMKSLDYGKSYAYAHDFEGNFTPLEFMPEKLSGTVFYNPGKNSAEESIFTRLSNWWKGKYGYKK